MSPFEAAQLIINAYQDGHTWTFAHIIEPEASIVERDMARDEFLAPYREAEGDIYWIAEKAWLLGYRDAAREWGESASSKQKDAAAQAFFGDWLQSAGDMEAIADRETRAGYHLDKGEILLKDAATLKSVSVQSLRNILRDEQRRKVIFPSARFVGSSPQRGAWYLNKAEVEAWKPRTYPREETDLGGMAQCPHCGSEDTRQFQPGQWQCFSCGQQFTEGS